MAIARALINQPRVLLLDEPLGALDMKLRRQMQIELKRLQKKLGITFVYVTHDQEEAMTMSDRIAVMSDGLILQIDNPVDIYEKPKSRFVADFIGESNIFEGKIKTVQDGILCAESKQGDCLLHGEGFEADEEIFISVRPEYLMLSKEKQEGFSLKAKIIDYVFMGTLVKAILLTEDGKEIKYSRFEKNQSLDIGDEVYLYWNYDKGVAIKKTSFDEMSS